MPPTCIPLAPLPPVIFLFHLSAFFPLLSDVLFFYVPPLPQNGLSPIPQTPPYMACKSYPPKTMCFTFSFGPFRAQSFPREPFSQIPFFLVCKELFLNRIVGLPAPCVPPPFRPMFPPKTITPVSVSSRFSQFDWHGSSVFIIGPPPIIASVKSLLNGFTCTPQIPLGERSREHCLSILFSLRSHFLDVWTPIVDRNQT